MLVDVKYEVSDEVLKDFDIDPVMRLPVIGDTYLGLYGCAVECGGIHNKSDGLKIILRKKWKWPEWLTAVAIAMDSDGEWFAYRQIPAISGSAWCCDDGHSFNLSDFISPDFIPSRCKEDWKKSLIINPSRKA